MVFQRPPTQPNVLATANQEHQDQEQFLRFFLLPDTHVMLPVAQLTEVLTLSVNQIIPIPQMPHWVMGVYNWRGEILWLIDLGQLLGLTPWYQQKGNLSNCRAIVLHSTADQQQSTRNRSHTLGLIVSKVEDIEWYNTNDIQSPPASAVEPSLVPFLRGYLLTEEGEMLVTLDGEAILAAMPQC